MTHADLADRWFLSFKYGVIQSGQLHLSERVPARRENALHQDTVAHTLLVRQLMGIPISFVIDARNIGVCNDLFAHEVRDVERRAADEIRSRWACSYDMPAR